MVFGGRRALEELLRLVDGKVHRLDQQLLLELLALLLDETVGVFRLVGRRPDAALVYADAGRRAARYAARGASAPAGQNDTRVPIRAGSSAGGRRSTRTRLTVVSRSARSARL